MIDSFSNNYDFLSNMYILNKPLVYKGFEYTCVEAAYQAQKDLTSCELFINIDGRAAKKLGRKITLRPDWEIVKSDIMRELIHIKFTDPILRKLLLDTNDEELIEGNWWHDTYWGICNGVGKNMLGKILMEERKNIRGN